jgi:hypothetical protein
LVMCGQLNQKGFIDGIGRQILIHPEKDHCDNCDEVTRYWGCFFEGEFSQSKSDIYEKLNGFGRKVWDSGFVEVGQFDTHCLHGFGRRITPLGAGGKSLTQEGLF